MTLNSLSFSQQTSALEGNQSDEIRALVAQQLDMDIKILTNGAHLIEDLVAPVIDHDGNF
jgi:hypothetical protein